MGERGGGRGGGGGRPARSHRSHLSQSRVPRLDPVYTVKLSRPVATSNWIETNSPCGPHDAMPTEPRMVSVPKDTRTHARSRKPQASIGVGQGAGAGDGARVGCGYRGGWATGGLIACVSACVSA